MTNPLVSIIVPTFNSALFLAACLTSIKKQSYKNIELIVVDNYSADTTRAIAKKYTNKVFSRGPERSAQVNFGVTKARGEYVYKVDSDFILEPDVVQQCIDIANEGYDAAVVHNTPDESISWIAKVRKFEVDMYKYNLTHSSARFVKKSVYQAVGGFDESITAGEDYDFQNKLNRASYKTGFIEAEALHLGEPKNIWPHMKKYYSYGKDFIHYQSRNTTEARTQLNFFRNVYFKNWKKFAQQPFWGASFVLYNIAKYGFGATGYCHGKLQMKLAGRK